MFKLIKKHKEIILLVLTIVLLYSFYNLIGIGCPIKFLTGISCPGCGMTRAFKSLLVLDVKSAFHYHPGFILVIIAAITIIAKRKISYNSYKLIMSFIVVALLLIYVIRIVSGSDIIEINPKSGLIYKTINIVLGN